MQVQWDLTYPALIYQLIWFICLGTEFDVYISMSDDTGVSRTGLSVSNFAHMGTICSFSIRWSTSIPDPSN